MSTQRQYQIIVWGATGFTGQLVCEHILKRYQGQISWAMAGRSLPKLEQTREKLCKYNKEASNVDLLTASIDDPKSLDLILSKTLVAISTVGPYAKYGTPLVESAIRCKTHLCDITAEVQWVKDLIEKYHDEASINEVKIVNFCGIEVVPFDIGSYAVADYIEKKYGTQPEEISTVFSAQGGEFSGGSMDSLKGFLDQPKEKQKECHSVWCLTPEDNKQFDTSDFYGARYCNKLKTWLVGSVFQINSARTIRRTNYLLDNKYGDVIFNDSLDVKFSLVAYLAAFIQSLLFMALYNNYTRPLLRRMMHPAGQGPSRKTMENCFWSLKIYGFFREPKTGQAKVAHTQIKGYHDPGYMDTTLMQLEVAMTLALNNKQTNQQGFPKGGILTPAAAGAPFIFDRLCNEFKIDKIEDKNYF